VAKKSSAGSESKNLFFFLGGCAFDTVTITALSTLDVADDRVGISLDTYFVRLAVAIIPSLASSPSSLGNVA
jgi:hypothetical protein